MLNTIRKLIALICAITFVVCAVLGSTYAWKNEQQVLNDLSGKKTKFISVELLKLEKQTDSSDTEIPIADTVFYLFSENGTQIGGQYKTDKNGKISLSLSAGEYYFEEISPSIGYTYDTDENGEKITRYPFTVTDNDEIITVKAYNVRLNGALIIQKTVVNTDNSPLTDMQKKTAFEFTVTFSDSGIYAYRIDNGEEQILNSGQTIMLCSGQTAVFENIPVGVHYNVVETPIDGYICSSTGNQGNIIEGDSVASFVNKCDLNKLGSVIVSKMVSGEGADINKEFSFIATFGNITESFTLRHGESKKFNGLPMGTEYTVAEEDAFTEGYIATVKEYTGKIVNQDTVKLPFVNIYKPDPVNKTGSLTISKAVIGENADPEKEFTFTVVFEWENTSQKKTFTLKSGDIKTFENIPSGAKYTVTETKSAGYEPVMDTAEGIIIGDHTVEVKFTNIAPDEPPKKDKIQLTVTKILTGEILESDKQRDFAFTLIVDGLETKFTLKADESREFQIPVGAVYELHEDNYFADGFSQSIVNGFGVAENEPINVIVTNTYIGVPEIEIQGRKTWVMGKYTDVKLPESITIRLKSSDLLVEEKTVVPDKNGEWNYTFTVPKYNADGNVAVYLIEELPITGYNTSYDGYNITNTYVPPITVDLPTITKIVQGKNAPETKFEFEFKGNSSVPMPEGSEVNKKTLTLSGEGKIEIGSVTFTESGEYIYTVQEMNGGAEGWVYDKASYTITITVTENDNILSSKQKITKNDETINEVVFTNTYDESTLGDNIIINGSKTWNHGNNPEKNQPTSIIVEVYGDGKLTAQRQITVKDNWKYSFELPRCAEDGHEIVYTVDEAPLENYEKAVNGYDLTNTYIGTPNEPTAPQQSDNPTQTGDNFNIVLNFALMLISLIGFILATWFGKNNCKCKVKQNRFDN